MVCHYRAPAKRRGRAMGLDGALLKSARALTAGRDLVHQIGYAAGKGSSWRSEGHCFGSPTSRAVWSEEGHPRYLYRRGLFRSP